MAIVLHAKTFSQANGSETNKLRPVDYNSTHLFTGFDGVSLGGNTSGVLSNITSGTMILMGGNNITLSQQGQSIEIRGVSTLAQSVQPVSLSLQGNTVGQSSVTGSQIYIIGGNNITLSGGAGSFTISGPNTHAQQTGISAVSAGGASQSSGTVVFSNSNGISFGLNAGTITASHNGLTVQSVPAQSLFLYGNTLGASTITGSSIHISGGNNITLSVNAGTLRIDAVAGGGEGSNTFGMSNLGNTSGTTGVISGSALRYLFIGGNNVTLSQSLNGQSASLTFSAANQTVPAQSITIVGNTLGASSLTASSLYLSGGPNITLSVNAGSLVFSGGAGAAGNTGYLSAGAATASLGTVSFLNGSGVSWGINGQTLTASVAAQTIQPAVGSLDGSSGSLTIVAGNLMSISNNASTISIINILSTGTQILDVGTTNSQGTNSSRYAMVDHIHRGIGVVQISGNTSNTSSPIYGSLVLAGGNNITLSQVSAAGGATISLSAGLGGNTLGMSDLGNTSGTTGVVSGSAIQLLFAGGTNVWLSQSLNGNSATISISARNGSFGVSTDGNTFGSTGVRSNLLVLVGSGNISLSQSTAGIGSVTVSIIGSQSVQAQSITLVGNTAGASTLTASSIYLSGGNNITLSVNAGSLVISGGGGGGGAAISAAGSSVSNGTVVFSNSNGLTFGMNGSTITGSYTVPTQTVQAMSLTLAGNTLGQSTLTGSQITVAGGNNITVSGAAGAFTISGPNTVAQTVQAMSFTLGGNTAGQSTLTGSQITIAGGNNVTVSGAAGAFTISGAATHAQQTGISAIAANAASTVSNGTIVVSNSNNVSFGFNGSTLTASIPNQLSLNGSSRTALSISAGNNISISNNASTINVINLLSSSATAQDVLSITSAGTLSARFALADHAHRGIGQVQISGNTSNTSNIVYGSLVLAGGNNITLSQVSAAGGATITISAPSAGAGVMSFILGGNTAGQSTVSGSTITLAGGNNITLSGGAGAITISAGAGGGGFTAGVSTGGNTSGSTGTVGSQVVFVGGDNITLIQSTNGQSATISIDAGEIQQMTEYPPGCWATGSLGIITYGTISLVPIFFQKQLTASEVDIQGSFSLATSTSGTRVGTLTAYVALYTMNGSTLSSASSASQSFSFSYTSNASTSRFNGPRRLSIPMNVNASPGRYWYGINFRSVGGTGTVSITLMGGLGHTNLSGEWGQAANTSWRVMPALGYWSSSHSAIPSTIAISDIIGSVPKVPWILFRNIGY